MLKWNLAFAAIATASSSSFVASAFQTHFAAHRQQRQAQHTMTRHVVGTFSDSLSSFASPSEKEPPKEELTSPPLPHLTLDEQLASQLLDHAEQNFGKKNRVAYRSALENVRDSKARSQRRLSRSALEKKYADEKIAKLLAKVEQEKNQIEDELRVKSVEAQKLIDEEVANIIRHIQTEIDHEIVRESNLRSLTNFLESAIATKESEIAQEEIITADMKQVRAKVKKGAIASQIDDLLAQKVQVASIETQLVQDLRDCVSELTDELEHTKQRALSMGSALARIQGDETIGTNTKKCTWTSYSWSDVEHLETVLERALTEAEHAEKTMLLVRDWVHEAVWGKSRVYNEPMPESMKAVEIKKRTELQKEKELMEQIERMNLSTSTEIDTNSSSSLVPHRKKNQSKKSVRDLEQASEGEIMGVLGRAAGEAALAGGKTAILGIKTLLESVMDDDVGTKTGAVLEKSSRVTKGISEVSEQLTHHDTYTNNTRAMDSLKGIIQSEIVKDTLKSTGETFGALGEVAGEIAGNVKDQESSRQATNAAVETGKSLMSALNAAAVLGKKQVQKMKKSVNQGDLKP